MDRRAINQFIRANGGKQNDTDKTSVAYAARMTEAEFVEFREKIPFQSSWFTGTETVQEFRVWYNKLKF